MHNSKITINRAILLKANTAPNSETYFEKMSTAERLSKLKKTRGGHRGSTKRMIAELEKELIASSSSELDLVKIMQLKKNLEGKLPVVEKLDTE